MRVIGIDPGSRHAGWGVVECRGANARVVGWGRVSPPATAELGARLVAIVDGVERAIAELAPELVAIERVFHGASSRSLIVLAEARGALIAAVARRGLPMIELAPAAVKSSVTGSGRADKAQVMKMVRLSLGLGTQALSADESDALALALAAGQSALSSAARRL
jgi:crossover junction endodeoxyribonuclease RuvC